ncbi:MAG: Stringent starvation protein B [Hyphomicrobiales bacterium]|nr:Stringent starvation protein B [Hyphomicrobiales bacterium]
MPTDLIRYDLLVQDALKGVVRRVLANAIRDGIPGEHHFYLSFRTREKGVRISQALRDKYPDEMTIVLQHQFWDLSVNEYAIEVGLSFSNVPEKLVIPFDAVSGFFDPSVQFGLKFEQSKGEAPTGAARALPSVPKAEAQGKLPLRAAPSESAKPQRKSAEKSGRPAAEAKSPDTKPSEPKPSEAAKSAAGKSEGKLKLAVEADRERSKEEPKVISLDAFRKKP